MLRFLKIFSFVIIDIFSVFLVVFFWKFYPGQSAAKSDFPENVGKIHPKSGIVFPVFRLLFYILQWYDTDIYTIWSVWYYLTVEKRIFKKIQLVRDICQFLCAGSRFSSLRTPKGITGLCFHYSVRFASFAFRNLIFLLVYYKRWTHILL